MKKALLTLLLITSAATLCAQRQKTTVTADGEIVVGNQVIAHIEKERCKLLSPDCQFFITDENDNLLIAVTSHSFYDRRGASPSNPNGTMVNYLRFSFRNFNTTAEMEQTGSLKEETIVNIISRWRLIKNKKLDPDAVKLFVAAHGNRYSDMERMLQMPFPPEINQKHQ